MTSMPSSLGDVLTTLLLLLLYLQLVSCMPQMQSAISEETSASHHLGSQGPVQIYPLPDEQSSDPDVHTARPSRYESTVLARRLMALSRTGTVSTVFPANLTSDRLPKNLPGMAIGLPEYIASCEEPSGNPTLLLLNVEVSTQNAWAGSNVSLSVSWWDQYARLKGRDPWAVANLPRVTVVGYVEEISDDEVRENGVVSCFVKAHHDSVLWLPGEKYAAHEGHWMRLVVQDAYWIGGFGDANWIGWFDMDEWRKVSKEEWMAVKLPGEA